MKVGINGAWKDLDKAWVGINGVWKEVEKAWVGIGGVWKEVEGIGLVGLYLFRAYIVSGNFRYERVKLNPITLAAIQTTIINYESITMDYGTTPGRLFAISPGVYLHELNVNTFNIISSTRIIYTDGGVDSYQHNKVGGTENSLYTSHFVIYYGEDPGYTSTVSRRNINTYAVINQISENASSGGNRQIRGIDGIGSRLYRYYYYNGYEIIQELNPESFIPLRELGQGSNVYARGLGGDSNNSLVGGLNVDFTTSRVVSYNLDTLTVLTSMNYTGQQHEITGIANLK